MERNIGKTGITVNAIGFGGLPLSEVSRPPESDALGVIHAALSAGVNFIDTADVYCLDDSEIGHNERLIALALKQWHGHEVMVATKGGCTRPGGDWGVNGRPEHLRQACERSLKALGAERIFLYQLHAPDDDVPLEDSIGELARLQSQGKIAHIGVSNVNLDELGRAQKVARIESVQNRLNPLCQRDLINGVADACAKHGMTYIAYSPVGGGQYHAELGKHPLLVEIGVKYHATPHQVMLAWVLSKGEHILPIPGASKQKSILDSVKSAELKIDSADLDAIDQLTMVA